MKSLIHVLWIVLICTFPHSSFAHHTTSHAGTGFALFNPFSTESRPPKTYIALDISIDELDDHLGSVAKYQLSGEYVVHPRVSVGARLPFATLNQDFLPQGSSLGDVAFTLKSLLWSAQDPRMGLTFGQVVSFPTGKKDEGYGAGNVIFSPYLTYSAQWFHQLDSFITLGTSVLAADQPAPSLDFSTGITVPIVNGKAPLKILLALQGSTALSSENLGAGSTKAFLNPALFWQLTPKLSTSLGARVSVIDTLQLKPGVILSPLSPLLLTDVKAGFLFNTTYAF